jgi:hypothetical protein
VETPPRTASAQSAERTSSRSADVPHRALQPTNTPDFVVRFHVQLSSSVSDYFDVRVRPVWAPLAAQRFDELVRGHWFDSGASLV